MAISIQTEISSQTVSSAKSYKYLFEPLRIKITEVGSSYCKITILIKSLYGTITLKTYTDYFFSETNASGIATVDLMELARDFIEAMYKIGLPANITDNPTLIANFWLEFRVTTNLTTTPTYLSVIPVIGGRSFEQFSGNILYTTPLTEWEYYGLTCPYFKGYPHFTQALKPPTDNDLNVTMSIGNPTTGRDVCGAYLIWKSRFGGWTGYGFDIFSETENLNYESEINSDYMRAATRGFPYVPTNYTQVSTSSVIQLKSLSVSKEEAQVLRGLNAAPVAYIMRSTTSKMELMRITGVSIPINNLANGVDVTVSLSSISQSIQNVR